MNKYWVGVVISHIMFKIIFLILILLNYPMAMINLSHMNFEFNPSSIRMCWSRTSVQASEVSLLLHIASTEYSS